MTKLLNFFGISTINKFSFMSSIGGLFVIVYLLLVLYDSIELGYLFSKKLISSDVFERLKLQNFNNLYNIVTLIVVYFFSKTTTGITSISSSTND